MANLKEIRSRISSVNSTMQITSAMKMVSAAKLKRATDAIVQMRPYSQKLQEILSNLSGSLDSSAGAFSEQREVKNILIVSITSNRGLCGGFNNNVIKATNGLINKHSNENVVVLPIGKKAMDVFKKGDNLVDDTYPHDLQELYTDLTFSEVAAVADMIMEKFAAKEMDQVIVVYNAFKNAAVQILKEEPMLPITPPEVEEGAKAETLDYIFEPSKEEIVSELIPKMIRTQLFKAILDSVASEHGARMTSMHKATENAGEMLDDLKLTYNKARQAAITNEILEIVGGAEALAG